MNELRLWSSLLWFLVAAAVVSLPLAFLAQLLFEWDYGAAFLITLTAVVLVVVALVIVVVILSALIGTVMSRTDTFDLRLARKCAGEPGTCVRHGPLTVWFSGSAELGRRIEEQLQVARDAFASLLGKSVEFNYPLRLMCFETTAGYARYVQNWWTQFDCTAARYSEYRVRKIILCEQYLEDWLTSVEHQLLYECSWYLFKKSNGCDSPSACRKC